MPNNWTGVRPLRYRNDIYALLEVIDTGKADLLAIKDALVTQRMEREERRLKLLRVRRTTEDKRRKREEFITKAEQLLRVLRRTGLVDKEDKQITLTKKGRKILRLDRERDKEADALVLESLLNSSYETYWLFLKSLDRNPISIPRRLSKRDKKLRKFISSQGFPLDVWSFFILRDLYYEFGLLNYVTDVRGEKIFPLFELDSHNTANVNYLLHVHAPEGVLHYWPSLSTSRFLELLVDTYLSITAGRWDLIAEIIELRERFSVMHKIPEIEFNEQFLACLDAPGEIRVIPSVGYIGLGERRGYLAKVVNLPSDNGLPWTLIRIEQGKNG